MSKILDVPSQFVLDGVIGNYSEKLVLDEQLSNKIKFLIAKYQTTEFDKGSSLLSVNFSGNGGVFEITQITETEADDDLKVDFSTKDNIYKSVIGNEKSFLIEPFYYPDIQPYNRQEPYYLSRRFSDLEKKSFKQFNLYTLIPGKYISRIYKRLDNYLFNDFWNTVSFDLVVKNSDVLGFVGEFITIFNMEELKGNILGYLKDKTTNNKISNCKLIVSKLFNRLRDFLQGYM